MFEVTNERFEELVSDALAALPECFSFHMENVVIAVEDVAVGQPLFGLYEGIPLTKRSLGAYSGVLPDRITLFQRTICHVCSSEQEVRDQVRTTLLHEVAHYYGISDPRLEELGWS